MRASAPALLVALLVLFQHGAAIEVKEGLRAQGAQKGWAGMDDDGGAEYEFGGQQDQSEDFSEQQYESDDPNDDENGYTGNYNAPGVDLPDGDDVHEGDSGYD